MLFSGGGSLIIFNILNDGLGFLSFKPCQKGGSTIDGRSPAVIPLFSGFFISQVVAGVLPSTELVDPVMTCRFWSFWIIHGTYRTDPEIQDVQIYISFTANHNFFSFIYMHVF